MSKEGQHYFTRFTLACVLGWVELISLALPLETQGQELQSSRHPLVL